jgi:hypothetical protein
MSLLDCCRAYHANSRTPFVLPARQGDSSRPWSECADSICKDCHLIIGMLAGGSNRWMLSGPAGLRCPSFGGQRGGTMRADGEVQWVSRSGSLSGARAFPRWWNIGEGRRAQGSGSPVRLPYSREWPPVQAGVAPRLPPKRVSPRSVTPHHRSASPFPFPSIPLRAGHPNVLPASAGATLCLGRSPARGRSAPPRRDRNTRSRLFRCPSEQMPRSLGTCGHGPSCSLPSVVNRWLQRKRWCWLRVGNPLLSQCCPASHCRYGGYPRGRLMLKSVRAGGWILYRGNAQFRLSISLHVTTSASDVKAVLLPGWGKEKLEPRRRYGADGRGLRKLPDSITLPAFRR